MKTFRKYIACSLFLLALTGCDLTALNENPNEPTDEVAYNMMDPRLGSALRDGLSIEGDDEQRVKSLMIDFFAQIGDGGGQSTKNYVMIEDWSRRMYKRVQSNVASLNIVIRNLSEADKGDTYTNSLALAKIWRVYVQMTGVDFFGPIPFPTYKEIEENPPYKSVKDTYTEFFAELDEAIALIDKEAGAPAFVNSASDALYANDMKKWKKFANSLRLRFALRLSEIEPATCTAEAGKAIESGVFDGVADNATIAPLANGDWGKDYNYTMFQITWSAPINLTASFEKLLANIGGKEFPAYLVNKRKALSGAAGTPLSAIHPAKADPRATFMFDPAYTSGDWKGMPYGLSPSVYNEDANYKKNDYAEFGHLIKNGAPYKTRPYDLFLYEEVCFLKAEAALRGFIAGDAKAEYEKGVRASFDAWEVSADADDYLASTDKNLAGASANFDDQTGAGNTALEKIITQKYIAAFPDVSFESWNDKRRLNLPRMDVGIERNELYYNAGNKNVKDPKNFIKRVQYPEQEALINKAEYEKGVQLLGGADNVATPLWWDINSNYCTSAE
ncbi:MAG: SusD/RagB family nutrient-binding outer membrane lipoprotein [Tannerellaceae bacterium]|jgi:hypothetical protein|nr:SusD/RagB family nutrient-binding outer membrane lipoprotein [Tannerellaceae bacterium]